MTKEEADMLIAYYDGAPREVVAMKREIGLGHPIVRYIEALELSLKYADSDRETMTEQEDECYRSLSRAAARKFRGEQ